MDQPMQVVAEDANITTTTTATQSIQQCGKATTSPIQHNSPKKTTSKDLLYVNPNRINKDLIVNKPSNNNNITAFPTKPKTFKMPTSSILDRVKNFLPEMESANQRLSQVTQEEKEEMNIENVENDDKVIEMNINLVEPELLLSEDDDDSDTDSDTDSEIENKDSSLMMEGDTKMKKSLVIEEVNDT